MAQNTGNARNILVGASPLFLSVEDSTTSGYVENLIPGTLVAGAVGRNKTAQPKVTRSCNTHSCIPRIMERRSFSPP
jgi:hypothetical protein